MTLQLEICSKERVSLRNNLSSITIVDVFQVHHEETEDKFRIVGIVTQLYGQGFADQQE